MYFLLVSLALSAFAAVAATTPAEAASTAVGIGGHIKYQLLFQTYPADSLLRDLLGSSSLDQALESRVDFAATSGSWEFQTDYQFIALRGDTLELANQLPGSGLSFGREIDDDRRWLNLSYASGAADRVLVHRLDRLSLGYTTERSTWRFGRQAISWGNGLVFTPMDVFNPFDPAAVDKEYKTGDDMLYGQWLLPGGSDLQGVAVIRRDPVSGHVQAEQSSLAVKYHGFLGMNEYDLLAAEHYGERLLAIGGNADVGGAVWRGDLVWTRTDRDEVLTAVASLSHAWTWGGRNFNGLLEYYYNGFGQRDSAYAPAELLANPDLLRRLERGEVFTLGRHYLAASATIEITPLFLLTPTLFANLGDPSALAQLVAQWDLRQDLLLRVALNLPLGPPGSEYGGPESVVEGRYLATGAGLFAQLAWYF
jgi:hypothetical protein